MTDKYEAEDVRERYAATGAGWELDSIAFMKQVCIDVGSRPRSDSTDNFRVMVPCRWEDDPRGGGETTFWMGDKQLGGWSWKGLRHAIENGYSQSFCRKMVQQLKQALDA